MDVVSSIGTAVRPSKALIEVGLRCEIPRVL
jgi:hypothetical protein